MDYFLNLGVLFLTIAMVISILSSMFYSLSSDDYKTLKEANEGFFNRINKMKSAFFEVRSPFLSIELVLYFLSVVYMHFEIKQVWQFELNVEIMLIIAIVFIYGLLRTLSYAIASHISISGVLKVSALLQFLMFLSAPIAVPLGWINSKVSKKEKEENTFEELSALVETVCEENGEKNIGEYTLLKNVIKFKDVYVTDIMTPRTVIYSCGAEDSVSDLLPVPEFQMYSRIPIRNGETMDDGVIGYALSKDVYRAAVQGKSDLKIKEISREIFYVPENSGLEIALDILLKKKQTMLLVVDEYGGIEGLITMEDIVETLLGAEILDEGDKIADLRELAKQRRDKRIATQKGNI